MADPRHMTERDLQYAVIGLAQTLKWKVAHFRPARTEQGWRTPVQADGKGFPDLVLAKPGRLIFAELKGDRGRLSAEQKAWINVLGATDAEVYVWTPDEWLNGAIETILRRRGE